MRQDQMRSVRCYKRPRYRVGMPATTAPNRLQREFTVAQPDQVWITDHGVGTRRLDDGCLAQAAQEPSVATIG